MNINDYIEKLRKKPVHQRERMVIAATAVSFLIILVIWLVSFSEMNKEGQVDANPSAIDQLGGLKSNVSDSKKSIEDMWNQMPSQTGASAPDQNSASADNNSSGTGTNGADSADSGQNSPTDQSQQQLPMPSPPQSQPQDNNQPNSAIPQLP